MYRIYWGNVIIRICDGESTLSQYWIKMQWRSGQDIWFKIKHTECARYNHLHRCLQMRISNCKIFGLHPKVMLPQNIYACNFVVIILVGPTKVSIMKLKCTVLNRMWQHDFMMKQIFFSFIFLSENTGRLAKHAGYLGHDPWHTR